MATLNFITAYSSTLDGAINTEPSTTVFAEDLGLCSTCVAEKGNCWACLETTQQVFLDEALTNVVSDGYYRYPYSAEDPNAIWHIVGGYPQSGGFYN
jgi:hypothetical protein